MLQATRCLKLAFHLGTLSTDPRHLLTLCVQATFIRETTKIPDNTYFRLKVMTFDNVPWVATMKKNEHYFPTVEFIKDPSVREGWRRVMYEGGKVTKGEGELMPEGGDDGAESVEA